MSNLTIAKHDWEHLYTQFKALTGDPVICMMHKRTRKFIYLDIKLNRLLSKQEAVVFRPDVTGIHIIHP